MRSSGVHSWLWLARNGVLPGGWWRTGDDDSSPPPPWYAWERGTSRSMSELVIDSLVTLRCNCGWGWLAGRPSAMGDESGAGAGCENEGCCSRSHWRWRRRSMPPKYPSRRGEDCSCELEPPWSPSSSIPIPVFSPLAPPLPPIEGAPHTGGGGMRATLKSPRRRRFNRTSRGEASVSP